MKRKVLGRPAAGILAVVVLVFGISGCSISPNDFPSVRGGVAADYVITAQFENVMNLPSGADVVMNGIRVGEVQSLRAHEDRVDVRLGLGDGTRVPAGAGAVIRQNTLLGDTYIALTPDPDSGENGSFIAPDGIISVERTLAPPQLEDTIAVLAHFVNGGSIGKLQDTMATLNDVVPPPRELRALSSTLAVDLRDLARNTTSIDRFLNGLSASAESVAGNADEWQPMFSAEGLEYWDAVANQVISHISTLLPSVGTIFSGGLWLSPMLESLTETLWLARGDEQSVPTAATRLNNFLRTTLLPWSESPSVDIVSLSSPAGDQLVDDAETILRMLGAVR
ncbi:MAG: MlaD family protein [Gordonia sp. (in: high G+C Gram-positive bacteria)]|uniref:MlaD family protein n=1 Tax=Gordonia sp. (in: high G+C Gram-positive bacteria) TaxID=84139 RepID=UPI003BB7B8E0